MTVTNRARDWSRAGPGLRYDAGGPGERRMLRIAKRHPRIAVEPEVMGGKPCIKGTRIPVDLVLRYLGDGQSVEDILHAFPGLTREDAEAAEACAVPTELLNAVVAHFHPVQVILFGSRARGEAGADSDIAFGGARRDVPTEKLGWRSAFAARLNFHPRSTRLPGL